MKLGFLLQLKGFFPCQMSRSLKTINVCSMQTVLFSTPFCCNEGLWQHFLPIRIHLMALNQEEGGREKKIVFFDLQAPLNLAVTTAAVMQRVDN